MAVEFRLETKGMEGWTGKTVLPAIKRTMSQWGTEWITALVSERMNGSPGVTTRSGNLSRDWNTTLVDDGNGVNLTIASHGTGNAYAGLQERGGTIRPTRAKWLWIPLDANKTAMGVARVTPTQAMSNGGFFTNARGGGKLFWAYPLTKAERKKGRGNLVPLFALKSEVYVPPRLGAADLFRDRLPDLQERLVRVTLGAINGG